MGELFDRYVVVDWSAANRPTTGRDSIWIAVLGESARPTLSNPRTRRIAAAELGDAIAQGRRTLVGIDVGLGFPAGTAAAFGFTGSPWRSTWRHLSSAVTDDDHNRNNRFDVAADLNDRTHGAGPFWGAPDDARLPMLARTKPSTFPLPEFRETERVLRAEGWHPKSVWQLLGAGSVGGQTLTAIPVLDRLRAEHGTAVEVWPFTCGIGVPDASDRIVVTEVWPSRFETGRDAEPVRDARQVAATADALRSADRDGRLAEWFDPVVEDRRAVEEEEGWVLGPTSTRAAG